MELTPKQIGRRIMELRKRRGWSQEDLARRINLSRPSVAQIELGNRGIDIIELRCLASVLEFSLDEFLAGDLSSKELTAAQVKSNSDDLSVAAPVLQVDKLKNVLLYVLERSAGKPNVGETVLYKLLYFADFNYYEIYQEFLTGAQYRKLPFGPVPQKLDAVIISMIRDKQLQRIKGNYHGYPQTRYIPLQKPDLTKLKGSEMEVIDRVIAQMSDWSAAAISNYSHQDMPWRVTKEGEVIGYALAFCRQPPFSVKLHHYTEEE